MKKLNFRKTAIILPAMLAVYLSSCTDAGTLKPVDKGNNEEIEVFKYYYDDGIYNYP